MTSGCSSRLSWERAGWAERAGAWVNRALADHGLRATGPAEAVHVRIWSAVLRVPTDGGAVYLKPENPRFQPIAVTPEANYGIVGKVAGLCRF